ncbi:hypothetical protein AruPA_15085 [Acidiphilium sp. PA]|uniref:hypothetical protein n=1 Tax=Acidiphilium sp. PA TaxID=2871705 RepID=UPI00224383FB|nr:hypothetical protein [Acidiphilium sp. PA]MCW8308363.1 hypothetical protein [Acidiphilium sp. PA]
MIRRALILAGLALLPLPASAGGTEPVAVIGSGPALAGGVRTATLALTRFQPAREADGVVIDPAGLLTLRAALINAGIRAHLSAAELTRTHELYRAGQNVSAASLQQAEAADALATARLQALTAQAIARFGPALAGMMAQPTGPVAAIAAGKAALVAVALTASPPPRASGRDAAGAPITLKLIGAMAHAPAGRIGPGVYYRAPLLPAGEPLALHLDQADAHRGYLIPASAIIYQPGRRAIFVETAPHRFSMVALRGAVPVRTGGRLRYAFVRRANLPPHPAVAIAGAGLLLSIVASHNGQTGGRTR